MFLLLICCFRVFSFILLFVRLFAHVSFCEFLRFHFFAFSYFLLFPVLRLPLFSYDLLCSLLFSLCLHKFLVFSWVFLMLIG